MTLGEMDGTLQIDHDLVKEDSKTTISQAAKIYNLTKCAPA
jgi:hypothetical protein